MNNISIIGGGLAGCEAAWQIAQRGIQCTLYEMRPLTTTNAHQSEELAELVCSNSFRSDDKNYNAVGLLHEEMRICKSIIMEAADNNRVPAGSALAVDRDGFAQFVTDKVNQHELISIVRQEINEIPDTPTIIATGPLTASGLAEKIAKATGSESLSFFDAIAPIIHKDSVDMKKAWFQSRYDKTSFGGEGRDYLNCPMNEEEYTKFINEICKAEKTEFKEWENVPYFEGCLPVEVMAERGIETLRFGPMKPVGLTNQHKPEEKPYAVVQLRQDNKLGTLYNMVGFQTKLVYSEQTRIFRMIPGLENAQFARLGGIHRNTYINSPELLDENLRLKTKKNVRFAGQITGCEGYVESAAIGLLAGRFTADEKCELPPVTTAMGALLNHITQGHISAIGFQPMNVNFGLFPPLEENIKKPEGHIGRWRGKDKAKAKKMAVTKRALEDIKRWLATG